MGMSKPVPYPKQYKPPKVVHLNAHPTAWGSIECTSGSAQSGGGWCVTGATAGGATCLTGSAATADCYTGLSASF